MMIHDLLVGVHSLLFPASCPGCGIPVEDIRTMPLCAACFNRIPRVLPPWCRCCGFSLAHSGAGVDLCGRCRTKRFSFDSVISACHYETPVKELITALKYQGQLSVAPFLGNLLSAAVMERLGTDPADGIVPVPLHPIRMRERTFNQALALAQELSKRTGLPCWNKLLIRERATPPQADLSKKERLANVRAAFSFGGGSPLRAMRILLVDDVFTTGATANACAKLLKQAGADQVTIVTVARQELHTKKAAP